MTDEYKKRKADCFISICHETRNVGVDPVKHMKSIQSIADEAAKVAEVPIDKEKAISVAASCFERLLLDGSNPGFYEVENCYLDEVFAERVKRDLIQVASCVHPAAFL